LLGKGIPQDAVEKIQPIILLSGSNKEKLERLKEVLGGSEIGLKGVEELETVFNYLESVKVGTEIELDLTLARGLNYYTGAIIEVKAKDVAIGSICGGGRYDDLTGIFGMPDVSGVGISFGADRIYDVLNQLDKFPTQNLDVTQVLFINFGKEEENFCLPVAAKLREQGLNVEIYPEAAKMKKQMAYADKREIPCVVMIGANEMAENKAVLKNMLSGEQTKLPIEQLHSYFN
jgi:histidyl-tRNA synthetase